jgi:hypothetical protein
MGKLIYAFIEDSLYNPPVVAQNVYFAVRSDLPATGGGAGTYDHPFCASNPNLTTTQTVCQRTTAAPPRNCSQP